MFGLILEMVQDNSHKENGSYSNNVDDVYKSNVLHACDPIENWVNKILCIIHFRSNWKILHNYIFVHCFCRK